MARKQIAPPPTQAFAVRQPLPAAVPSRIPSAVPDEAAPTHWTSSEAAAAWGCSRASVARDAARGRIPGAELVRGKLLIPAGTARPAVDLAAPDGGGRGGRT